MSEANKEIVRRWQEAYNTGELDVLDELLDPSWGTNGWNGAMPQSVESAKAFGRAILQLWPDYHCTILDLIAEGDSVAMRYAATFSHSSEIMGYAPTGQQLTTSGIAMFKIVEGRIVQFWAYANELEFLEKLGLELPAEWGFAVHRTQLENPAGAATV